DYPFGDEQGSLLPVMSALHAIATNRAFCRRCPNKESEKIRCRRDRRIRKRAGKGIRTGETKLGIAAAISRVRKGAGVSGEVDGVGSRQERGSQASAALECQSCSLQALRLGLASGSRRNRARKTNKADRICEGGRRT